MTLTKPPKQLPDEQLKRLLKIIAYSEIDGQVSWHTDLTFYVGCNDLFGWGAADAEPISDDEDVALLQACLLDAGDNDGAALYCCRKRKLRPQNAMYRYILRCNWKLFDACGPERDVTSGNPCKRPAHTEAELCETYNYVRSVYIKAGKIVGSEKFTCSECHSRFDCDLVFDVYNLDGKCLKKG